MFLYSKNFSARGFISVLCLSALLPLGAALTGCGDAPKIPGAPKTDSKQSDGPTAGAPPPSDEEKSASEGKPAAPSTSPAPRDDEYARTPAAAAEKQARAQQEELRREAEEMYRRQAQQQEQGAARKYGYETDRPSTAEAPSQPKKAKPPSYSAPKDVGPAGGSAPAPTAAAPPPPPVAAPMPPAGGAPDASATRGLGSTGAQPGAGAPAAEPPKAFDVVPVFYGTDRAVEPNAKRLQFGTERFHKLQLGRALITVPDAHKVPNIERPWVVELPYFKYKIYEEQEDPAKHFTMQEIAALTKEQMLAYVKERLAKSSTFKDHAFVFVHGFNTSFDAALYRTAQIAYDLKFDGAPFVYSWPSGGKVASYTYDRGSAEQAEPHLAEFLDMVIRASGAKSISLIAHSMGNELLLRVLERIKTVVPPDVVISQVILAAPDVDRDKFANIAREITNFAQGVTLYASSNDKALGYSSRFWGGVPRAGDVPSTGPLIVAGVDTIDVSAVSTDSLGLNHSTYAENKVLLDDIAQLLRTGERPPDKRVPSLQTITTAAGTFWRYPSAVH